jgi:plastocyanin
MRRPLIALSLTLIALSAAACAQASPGWTYAAPTEPPPATPAASGAASTAPSEAPASAAPTEAASGGSTGATVQISALNIAFEQSEVSAPANTPFVIHFDNKDLSIPHDIQIKDASGKEMFKGDVVTGPAETDYHVPALPPGTYQFMCTIHPNMTGTLTVGP